MKRLFLNLSLFAFLNCAPAEEAYPAVVLGGGIAGLTSATYLARAGLKPLVFLGPTPGGVITGSPIVQNWPGELEITGTELAQRLQKQAQENGALLDSDTVTNVDFSKRPFTITTKQKTIKAHTCIIATGAQPNFLGIPGEQQYFSRGVSTCALCDGSLFKDKTVAIVGGGDSALLDAQYLSNIAKKVFVIVRKESFRTIEEKRKNDILKRPNIEVLYNTAVKEIEGDGQKLTSLTLSSGRRLTSDALFLAIGSKPNTQLFQGQLELDNKGYVVLKNAQATSVEGVFAAGDVADQRFTQASTAAGDAAKAAIQAERSLSIQDSHPTEITSLEQLEKQVSSFPGTTFVYFSSPHCPPCKIFGPVYELWAKRFSGKIQFLKVNVEHSGHVANAFELRGVPTVLIMNNEKQIVQKCIGLKEIESINLSTHF